MSALASTVGIVVVGNPSNLRRSSLTSTPGRGAARSSTLLGASNTYGARGSPPTDHVTAALAGPAKNASSVSLPPPSRYVRSMSTTSLTGCDPNGAARSICSNVDMDRPAGGNWSTLR